MRARVVFLVRNIERDLPGLALVGYHLRKRGVECVFSTGSQVENLLRKERPGALVLDHLAWDYSKTLGTFAKGIGVTLAILPTSGVYQEADKSGYLQIAGSRTGAASLVDAYLAWGPGIKEMLVREGVLPEAKIHVVGSPRFDWYVSPLRETRVSRERFAETAGLPLDWRRPLVLWTPSNLSVTPVGKRGVEERAESEGVSIAEIQAEVGDTQEQYRVQSEVLLKLSKKYKDWTFLVKLHPFDRSGEYDWLADVGTNVRVMSGGRILESLYYADVVLQRYSTTVCEAWMLGKPVLALEMGDYQIPLSEAFASGCERVRNEREVAEALERYAAGAAIPAEQTRARTRYLEEFFFRVDGQSANRCAIAVQSMLSGSVSGVAGGGRDGFAGREGVGEGAPSGNGLVAELGRALRHAMGRVRRAKVSRAPTVETGIIESFYSLFERVLG